MIGVLTRGGMPTREQTLEARLENLKRQADIAREQLALIEGALLEVEREGDAMEESTPEIVARLRGMELPEGIKVEPMHTDGPKVYWYIRAKETFRGRQVALSLPLSGDIKVTDPNEIFAIMCAGREILDAVRSIPAPIASKWFSQIERGISPLLSE